jgi:N-acetylneuraminic acid mutarotase
MGPLATVRLVKWNRSTRGVTQLALPDLPEAVTNATAAWLEESVYVAGGEGRRGPGGAIWRLDLRDALANPKAARWEPLPAWPGRPRFGGILVPVTTPRGAGLFWGGGMEGPARSASDYLRDAFMYLPTRQEWSKAAPLPRGAVLGAAVAIDASRVLVLGGSDGHDFARMKEMGERYRIPNDLLLYDAATDRWSAAGTMPLGVVGAAVVPVTGGWLVAGGEYSPGLRTSQVLHFSIARGVEPE